MSDEQIEQVCDYFEPGLFRPLLGGKFSLSQNSAEDLREAEKADDQPERPLPVETEPETSETTDAPKEIFVVNAPKKNAPFSTKSFVSEYTLAAAKRNGKLLPTPSRLGDLSLLCAFAWMGALTRRQIEAFLGDGLVDRASFERVIRSGYVSSIEHPASGKEYFAVSDKGAEIFRKDKCVEVLRYVENGRGVARDAWNVKRCLPLMEDCLPSFERLATVALYLYANVPDSYVLALMQRKKVGANRSIVRAVLEWKQDDVIKKTGLLIVDAGDRTAISAIHENSLHSKKDELVEEIAENAYFCEIADDGETVSFQRNDGGAVGLEEMLQEITGFPAPAPSDDDPPYETDEEEAETAAPVESERPAPPAEIFDLTREDDPALIARLILENRASPAQKEPFDVLARSLLRKAGENGEDKTDYIGRAVVLLGALALSDPSVYGEDYKRLLLAVDLPLGARRYAGDQITTLFGGEKEGGAAHLAALLRAAFCPDDRHDYSLGAYMNGVLKDYDRVFADFICLKQTFNEFTRINKELPGGFSGKVTKRFVDAHKKAAKLKRLSEEANPLKRPPHISQRVNGIPELLNECFGENSLLGISMEAIASPRGGDREFARETYESFTDGGRISSAKISSFIDDAWRKVRTSHNVTNIIGAAREKLTKAVTERLNLIERWLDYDDDAADIPDAQKIISAVRRTIRDALQALRDDPSVALADKAVLNAALTNMLGRLDGGDGAGFAPEDWLSGGDLPVEAGAPVLRKEFIDVENYEPWRNALRHIAREPRELSVVLERIDTEGDPLYDNLSQAIQICQYGGDPEKAELYRAGIPNAQKTAERDIARFMGDLEVDYAYGRVSDSAKETALDAFDEIKSGFYENADFGRLRAFLRARRETLDQEVAANREKWARVIEESRGRNPNARLDRAEALLREEDASFIQVEEALNAANAGANASAFDDPETAFFDDADPFAEFIDEKNYGELWRFCNKDKGKDFCFRASEYVETKLEEYGLSKQYLRSAKRLINGLPNVPQTEGSGQIKNLLEELGFTVSRVERINRDASPARFIASVAPDKKNRSTYNHPISAMGTKIAKELEVVELFGSVEPESIINEVRKIDSKQVPVVLLNGALTLAQRRQLAKLFFKEGASPFVLVDWVLLLHLALHFKDSRDRLAGMLACALPYAGAMQLFSTLSSARIDDETFIGRGEELAAILNMRGPVIVYGGRQLGKTALLQRAQSRFHDPKERQYGALIGAADCGSEKEFVEKALTELNAAGVHIADVETMAKLCEQLRVWLKQKDAKLLLLIDEADRLLSAFSKIDDYAPLRPLEDLCGASDGNFKFVFAGLHNVFLAANNPNSIFGHFGSPLCIRPLSQADAYKLLARPLRYLGFSADHRMLSRILVNTVYYPGVIHFVGAALIDMLKNRYAEHFNDKDNPPYELTDRQIGSIMSSAALTNCIEQRIRMTLEACESYYAIARSMAALYYYEGEKQARGYAPKEILDCAVDAGGNALCGASVEECSHLLSELCDMSILVENGGFYKFRQSRFLSIVGKDPDAVWNELAGKGAAFYA